MGNGGNDRIKWNGEGELDADWKRSSLESAHSEARSDVGSGVGRNAGDARARRMLDGERGPAGRKADGRELPTREVSDDHAEPLQVPGDGPAAVYTGISAHRCQLRAHRA